MNRVIFSEEVIKFLRESLNKENYFSFFVGGSVPEKLISQSDLDLFFVVKDRRKNEFFENLVNIMDKFIQKNPKVVYSFFRGPIKYKNKGLIHFLIYTHGAGYDKENKEYFLNEHRTVLKSLFSKSKLISGKPLRELFNGFDLNERVATEKAKSRSNEKLEILRKEGYVNFPEWKKTDSGWKLLRTKKICSGFLKNYLIGYFEKNSRGRNENLQDR